MTRAHRRTHMYTHTDAHTQTHAQIQWSPSKTDTIEKVKFVLYKKVSFIQGFLNAILIHFGTHTNVLYVEGVLLEGFYCIYTCIYTFTQADQDYKHDSVA